MAARVDDQEDRYQRITLRIPKELHTKLMAEADAKSRSMNAEIIDRLSHEDQAREVELLKRIHAVQDASIDALERVIKTRDSYANLFALLLMDLVLDLRAESLVPAKFEEDIDRLFMMAKEVNTAPADQVREAVGPDAPKEVVERLERELSPFRQNKLVDPDAR